MSSTLKLEKEVLKVEKVAARKKIKLEESEESFIADPEELTEENISERDKSDEEEDTEFKADAEDELDNS